MSTPEDAAPAPVSRDFKPTAVFEIHTADATNLAVVVYDDGETVSITDLNMTHVGGRVSPHHPEVLISKSGIKDLLLKLRENGMEV